MDSKTIIAVIMPAIGVRQPVLPLRREPDVSDGLI